MSDEFPKMLYADDGRTATVLDDQDEAFRLSAGFSKAPFDIHRKVVSNVPINSLEKPAAGQPMTSATDPLGLVAFEDRIVDRLMERMRTEFFPDASDDKPRRGRPPKDRAAFATSDQD